jgi:cell division protein FtsW (lipid II flippase)
MPEFLRDSLLEFQTPPPAVVLVRLVVALALGGVVALVYRGTRLAADVAPSFTATLVLLCILIAMVTQVIGDNVARAFSLVGALSIVRFRTVVRDTQDTAYVIFAVGVGMAVGAGSPWLGVGGIVVVGVASFLMNRRGNGTAAEPVAAGEPFDLQVRLGIGHDPQVIVGPTLDEHVRQRRLMGMATARQGLAVDATYRTELRSDASADALVRALNRLDGVQSVTLQRVTTEEKPVAGTW